MILILVIFLTLLCSVYILNIRRTQLYFEIFIITSLGLGSYYNLMYRVGDLMISDIALILFSTSFLFMRIEKFGFKLYKYEIFVIILFFYMLLLGLVSDYKLGNILKDLKLFIYFFIPFIYIHQIKYDEVKMMRVFKCLIFVIFITILLNTIQFFTTGLEISNNRILRTFGIGVGYPFLVNVSLLCAVAKDKIIEKTNDIIYIFIQIVLIVSCIISYTRTVWIQLAISYILYYIFKQKNIRLRFPVRRILISMIIIMLISVISVTMAKSNNMLYILIKDRVSSIVNIDSQGENTLIYRIQDALHTKEKFKNIRIVFGYGFGDVRKSFGSTSVNEDDFTTENSFVYYMWKYGIISFCILIYNILRYLVKLYKSHNDYNKVMAISLLVYMIIDSMSGNLNKYYGMPLIAILLQANFPSIFNNYSDIKQRRLSYDKKLFI